MKYCDIKKAIFLSRPNRFVAEIEIDGRLDLAHVKNTGRCKELLIKGVTIYVREDKSPHRKTKYDLITVVKGDRLINMDSQVPNQVFREWVEAGGLTKLAGPIVEPRPQERITLLRAEHTYGNSRFDFYMEKAGEKYLIEVKGVTLEIDGVAMFPDAPTERGVKHINELVKAVEEGYKAIIVFVVQMKGVKYFTPNDGTHKAFGDALREATKKGLQVIVFDCYVTEDSIEAGDMIEFREIG